MTTYRPQNIANSDGFTSTDYPLDFFMGVMAGYFTAFGLEYFASLDNPLVFIIGTIAGHFVGLWIIPTTQATSSSIGANVSS